MKVDVQSEAVAHGVGLFETMLVTRGRVPFLEQHLARMTRSADALRFPPPAREIFVREVEQAAIDGDESAIRCLYVATGTTIGEAWTLTAHGSPIPARTLARRAHGRAITLDPSLARSLPQHKLTSYAACVVGMRAAHEAGADEGLFVARDGGLLEGTSTNVFAVTTRGLVTAPVAAGVLPGIVREWVIAQAVELGIAVEERTPSRDEVRGGAFLTGSLTTLARVQTLDGDRCADPGEPIAELAERWRRGVTARA